MDLLIVEPLEAEVLQWLDARHDLFYAPRLPRDRRAFNEAMADARAVMLPPQVAVTAGTLALSPRLRAIGRVVGGPENIDIDACSRAGIEIVRSHDATAPAEAEFMLGALLALLRPSPDEDGRVAGRELGACTVGLVGMTQTARSLARLLGPLGSRLVGYDPTLHASDAQWSRWGVQPLGLRELFEHADAVWVQMSYFSRYHGLLGERYLPECRPGQVLVSVSPVGLFDEEVLAAVLKSGRMAAAWLDSVGPGVLEPGQPLAGVQSLLVTPRLAAYTREARVRSAWAVARRIDEVLRLTPPTERQGAVRRAATRPAAPTPPVMAPAPAPRSMTPPPASPVPPAQRAWSAAPSLSRPVPAPAATGALDGAEPDTGPNTIPGERPEELLDVPVPAARRPVAFEPAPVAPAQRGPFGEITQPRLPRLPVSPSGEPLTPAPRRDAVDE
jgi:phosphoglycerate dehydrogenase-like enzyme